jgi:hypothetical protein
MHTTRICRFDATTPMLPGIARFFENLEKPSMLAEQPARFASEPLEEWRVPDGGQKGEGKKERLLVLYCRQIMSSFAS